MSNILQEWKTQLYQYGRNIRLFLLFNFVWNTGLGMFGLIYNLYVKSLGFSQTTLGDIIGMTTLASALILVPAGLLYDRLGPKRIMTTGIILVIVAAAARSLMVLEHGLLVTAFLFGMSAAIVSVTILPFMSGNSAPEQRVHLFSFNMALVMLANVLGSVLGGLLTDMFQLLIGLNVVTSLRATLLIGVGISSIGIIPVFLMKPTDQDKKSKKSTLSWKTTWTDHKSSLKVITLFAMIGLLSAVGGGMIIPYLNVYFADRFNASKTLIGIVVAMGQGATAIAFLIGPMIARRWGETRSVIILQLSSIPFLLVTAYTNNFYLASSGYLFRQALMNAANPFFNTIKMNLVHRSLRGLASSSGEAVFNLGWFIAAPVSTRLVSRYGSYYGYVYAFSITAVIYTIVVVLFYLCFGTNRFKAPEERS